MALFGTKGKAITPSNSAANVWDYVRCEADGSIVFTPLESSTDVTCAATAGQYVFCATRLVKTGTTGSWTGFKA